MDLVLACDSVLQNLDKICKRTGVGGGSRGKQRGGRGGTGTLSSAPSRGLCERMQRVVDMTTSLNRSFVDFMQSEKDEEASEEEDVDRARRLMMFRTILQDLHQAHAALQVTWILLALEFFSDNIIVYLTVDEFMYTFTGSTGSGAVRRETGTSETACKTSAAETSGFKKLGCH